MAASRTITGFSLVEGGPLFDFQRWAHLLGPRRGVLRRSLVLAALGWLPPLVLGVLRGGSAPGAFALLHTRFLIAIPILLWAELFVDGRVRTAVTTFQETGLVDGDDLDRFRTIVAQCRRLRGSVEAAFAMVAFAFGVSVLGDVTGYSHRVYPMDWWIAYVSLPLFRIVLLLWLWRWVVWAILLGRVSRLDLHLVATHPDLAGGLGFLEQSALSFVLVQVGAGAAIAGDLVVSAWKGAPPTSLAEPVVGFALIVAVMVLGPLLLFAGKLLQAKRRGQIDYGALAYRHNALFAEKWIRGNGRGQHLLGDPAISSLADIGTSYSVVDRMRLIPFSRPALGVLAAVCVAVAVPALVQRFPVGEMVKHVLKGLLL